MQLEGITWHALTLQAEEFGATKKLLMEVFGLRPAIGCVLPNRCLNSPCMQPSHKRLEQRASRTLESISNSKEL